LNGEVRSNLDFFLVVDCPTFLFFIFVLLPLFGCGSHCTSSRPATISARWACTSACTFRRR
jgi:hypothetical protein